MAASWLMGKTLSERLRADAAERSTRFAASVGRPPALVSLLVGDDAASAAYQRSKGVAAAKAGIAYRAERLAADATTADVVAAVQALNADAAVDGILVEMPLPRGCDTAAVQAAIDPLRDVDAVTPANLGRLICGMPGPQPATPRAVMALLADAGIALAGAQAVVVGRSKTVGLPVALLLLQADATVSICHSRSRDVAAVARTADVLVVAVGRPALIGPDAVKPGAVVVDVGTNWVDDGDGGRMVGDVDTAAVADVAGWLTPVPGGVGPVTTACVLVATLELAEHRAGTAPASPQAR